ncbi:MAG: MBL fold metallo-hydrolase, partial [Candidatus Gracilibacteria bacterium]|nr:MBL fold metallo-hydrolase [Candidatus Gracilibacteria bacterium]
MKIHFLGAARSVTGSKHLIEANGKRILLDCGLFQGKRKESFEKNSNLPLNPEKLDAVVLSHAHIDHSGALPMLIKNGFRGHIYCSKATQDITAVMLIDSAHIQEHDAMYFQNKLHKTAIHPIEPLYTEDDAIKTASHIRGMDLHREFEVTKGIFVKFYDAGHVLGSTIVQIRIKEGEKETKVVFTGDLGRKHRNILKDPEHIREADVLLTESTYGTRIHPKNSENRIKIKEIVLKSIKKGGKLIIPSFALERTQEVIFDLNVLKSNKEIPNIPVYIDSPLANKVTEIFERHKECFDEETKELFLENGLNPFDNVRFTHSVEESKKLNEIQEPCIIISASGMCEAGRIRHHLANNIEDAKNTILIVGYQAIDTLGRRIVEKRKHIKIFDHEYIRNAEVEIINGFSGHADKNDLLSFANDIQGLKKVFVVHGEEESSLNF